MASSPALIIPPNENYFDVTGTTNVLFFFNVEVNRFFILQFDDILTISHGLGVDLPGGVDFTTSPGDQLQCFSVGLNNVRVVNISKADGTSVVVGLVSVVDDLTPQLGGDLDGQDFEVSKINLKDYGEVTNAIGFMDSGTQDIDLELGNVVTAVVGVPTTFTFSNPTELDTACKFTLVLTPAGSTSLTWPGSVAWEGGIPAGSGFGTGFNSDSIGIFEFLTIDGGASWYGKVKSEDVKRVGFTLSTLSGVIESRKLDDHLQIVVTGINFGDSGKRVYLTGGFNNGRIYEHSSLLGYSISILSPTAIIEIVNSVDSSPQRVIFNNTGSKLFMVGRGNDSIYEFDLGTNFNLSTLSVVQVTRSVASESTFPSDIAFNNTGSKIFMLGDSSVHEYDLSTAYNLATLSSVQVTKSVAGDDSLAFNSDGSKLFIANGDELFEYNLTSNFNLSTLSIIQAFSLIPDTGSSTVGINFNSSGDELFISTSSEGTIRRYDLSIAFTISAVSSVQASVSVTSEDANPADIAFNNDGTKIFMIGSVDDSIHEYNLSTAFDLTTISPVQVSVSVASEDTFPHGIAFNNDGTKIFMCGLVNGSIHEYNLSAAFDLSTISPVQVSVSVASEDANPAGIAFNNDGTKIFMIGSADGSIHEYNLSAAFDLSTISPVQVSVSVASEDSSVQGLTFNNDGTKIFMIGSTSNSIYEYNLLINFDLSTISPVQASVSVASEDTIPTGLGFNNDVTKMFMVGSSNDSIYEYNL